MTKAEFEGFPLSPQQRRLWSAIEARPGAAFVSSCALRIEGRLDVERLRAAVDTLVRRHEILRTVYRRLPGMSFPLQVITDAEAGWSEEDLSGAAPAGPEEDPVRLAADGPGEPPRFDLENGPLLDARLVRLGPETSLLRLALPALAADRVALRNLVRELGDLYAGAGPADEEILQYADLAAWQNELLESTPEGREHWRRARRGDAHEIDLPLLRRTGNAAGVTAEVVRRVPDGVARACSALAADAGVPPAAPYAAAWHALLRRLAGREPVVGTAFEGRRYDELASAGGLLARHLPVAVAAAPELPFRDLVGRTGGALAEASEWQEAFDWEDWWPEEPVPAGFAVTFAHEVESGEVAMDGLRAAVVAERARLEPSLLGLRVVERPEVTTIEIEHDRERIGADEAERLAERYLTLLAHAAGEPGTPIERLEWLGSAERHALVAEINATDRDLSAAPRLHTDFFERARRLPDRIALVTEAATLSYGELAALADRLAGRLRARGAGVEAKVAVCGERSAGLIVALLATLRAGAAYVPLEPEHPDERLAAMLEDTAPVVLLAGEEQAERLAGRPEPLLVFDDLGRPVGAGSAAPVDGPPPPPEALAYVLFTSGSTGRPKGVAVSHRAIANRVGWMAEAFDWSDEETVAFKTAFGFDASIWEILLPLGRGGRLAVARPDGHRDTGYLVRWMARQRVSVLQAVPSLLRVLAEEPELDACADLRWVFSGGEALPSSVATELDRRLGARVQNLYGPTEAAIDATTWPANGAGADRVVPIGRPIANLRVYVTDRELGPVPYGVAGEVCIAGTGLARGYAGLPAATAAAFIPDPFAERPGGRLYRTGDLARHLPEGTLEFLGRLDQQVKIRGIRVEPGEVEHALVRLPGVAEAAVAVMDAPEGARLTAYVVAEAGAAPGGEALRADLAKVLPELMVPSTFVELERLPRTPSGKVDRPALPAPAEAATGEVGDAVAPRDLVEELLVEIWAEVLGIERVGVHDDFFALGGNSLIATQLTARLRQVLQVDLPIRTLFEVPTIERLAARVEERRARDAKLVVPPLEPVPRDAGPLPLSFAQERLYFLNRLNLGGATYNIPLSVHLEGELDVVALARAFEAIARRHEVLRTAFVEVDGRPGQEVREGWVPRLAVIDLSGLPDGAAGSELPRLASGEARRAFDLTRDPPLRTRLVRRAAGAHTLLLTMHHIVSDGWSAGIFLRELATLYQAFAGGREADLPELPIQYADYAAWQRGWLSGDALKAQLDYWRERLSGAPAVLELPTDRPRPPVQSYRGARATARFGPEGAERLRELARSEGATLFMTLLAGFQALLHRYTGRADIPVGVPVAGRSRPEVEGLIGFFVNTLVLRTRFDGAPSVRDALHRVREVSLGATDHQDLPFERLVDELQPERDLGRSPLFQVMFAFQNAPAAAVEGPRLALRPVDAHSGTSKFDLTLEMVEDARGLTAIAEYSTDLFDPATIDRMLGHLQVLLEAFPAEPGQAVAELPLLTPGEARELLRDPLEPSAFAPPKTSLIERFGRRAAERPDAIALLFESQRVGYGELAARARRLARRLRREGVGPEVRVCLLLERSVDLVVAILGVLEAGGAYVPLDPAYPADRVELVLGDCGAPVLLTGSGTDPDAEERARELGLRVLRLEEGAAASEDDGTPLPAIDPETAAYVIYTSGSTGTPKGVVVTHAAAARLFDATDHWFAFGPEDVWTLFHSCAFDFSVWELWGALAYGGSLLVVPRELARAPEAFHERVIQDRVTVLNQTPSAFRQLSAANRDVSSKVQPALRWIVFGGEALQPATVRAWLQRYDDDGSRLVNMYGITETTVHVTFRALDLEDTEPPTRSEVGVPIPDLRVHLRDGAGHLVPVGVPGEIQVSGAGLARGYLNRPALTAERFVPDPFGDVPGTRLYRSGDLARRRPDGDLEYLGRIDHQVKVRGFRIELAEIEQAIASFPGLHEAVVLLRDGEDGLSRLVAYVVPERPPAPPIEDLRLYVSRRLPEYMVPAGWVALDALPLTAHGKIDRDALPDPGPERPDLTDAYVAPRTELERALAGIWGSVLGLERVGIDDNFFVLGGDSMHILQVLARGREMEIECTVQQVYQHQTIRQLAEELAAGAAPAGEAERETAPDAAPETEEDLGDLLRRVEGMSDEEVSSLLAERTGADGEGG